MTKMLEKPREIEGFFDLAFYTPLGGGVARLLRPTPMTPNQVSWLSAAVAGLAALAYSTPTLAGAVTASVLLLTSGILDSADGQLARATGRTSELGVTLDGFCDSLSFGLIYLAAAIGFVDRGGPVIVIVPLMVAAGWSHSVQSSLVDYERQVFIHIISGDGRVAREDPVRLRGAQAAALAAGEGRWPQLLHRLRLAYCARQRRWLASTADLLALHERSEMPGSLRRAFADHYRETMRGPLRAWAVLAPNTHTAGVLLAGLSPFLFDHATATRWGLASVFIFDLALNAPMAGLLLMQRRLDRGLKSWIDARAEGVELTSSKEIAA